MRKLSHKRSRTKNKTIAIVAALVIGGGGAAAIGASAFAGGDDEPQLAASTIDCPDVSLALGDVPAKAKEPVGQKLAALDQQVAQAYGQWNSQEADANEALGQLNKQRSETIASIGEDLQAAGAEQPEDMAGMSQCQMKQEQAGQEQGGGEGGEQQASGPAAEDFVDITTVEPNANEEEAAGQGGSFETKCGVNENEHFNSDNVIAAPGVLNGAHHVHDYVGNEDTSAASSDESLAAAGTTCEQNDQSTHYWPVIRSLDGQEDQRGAVGSEQNQGDANEASTNSVHNGNQGQDAGQDQGQDQGQDAGQDQGQDQGQDAGQDQGQDQGQDAGQDQGQDQGQDAGQDQGQDQGQDAGQDQGQDQGQDAGQDQGQDQGQDAGQDQGQDQGQDAGQDQGQDQGQDAGQGEGEEDQVGGGEGAEAQPGDGGANDLNVGSILQPASATLKFIKGTNDDVVAMPKFLRIITGDAKSFTNGDANANASWSCEGFEDRQLTDKYPICPDGAQMIRTFNFQNCWDGQNTDSGNHRDHMAFAEEDGSCPDGFQAIPQLQQKIKYDIPAENLVNADTPFAVDSFPEQLHKPITDHSDFINVMPEDLMNEAVSCINEGREC